MTEQVEKKTYELGDMPSFDGLQSAFKDDEELDKEMSKTGGKYFEPGKYEVKIVKIEYTGQADKDPSWSKLRISYKGAGDKEINDTVMVPTSSEKYGEKGVLFPFKKLREFGLALGVQITAKELKTGVKTLFANPKKLVDADISIDVGYQGAHLKYDRDSKQYQLVLRDGNVARNATGEIVSFADRPSAGLYAQEQNITLEKGVRVLSYAKSSSGAGLAKDVGW